MIKSLLVFTLFFCGMIVQAQIKDTISEDIFLVPMEHDTISIQLNEVNIFPKLKFKEKDDYKYYYWFRRKVLKAYPYAVLAAKRIDTLHARLNRISSTSKKNKYTRLVQNYLEKEFTGQLKKLTRTEGRVLVKLIHRQTGKTAFNNIKELRSGWRAFWYNATANIFRLSIKLKYDPVNVNEDFLIEDIIQRAYVKEIIEEQSSKVIFDFNAISESRKGNIDVEEYKRYFVKLRKKKKKKKQKGKQF